MKMMKVLMCLTDFSSRTFDDAHDYMENALGAVPMHPPSSGKRRPKKDVKGGHNKARGYQ
jgi:hypothetical protein